MIDAALCARPSSQWLTLKPILASWLMNPALVVLMLSVLICLPWLIPRLRWKRQFSSLGVVLLVLYFSFSFPLTVAIANKGLVELLPADSGVATQAIVVLGRGDALRPTRVEVAAELWHSHRAPLIFASGVGDAPKILQLLRAAGIPEQALAGEGCSRTTEENARFTAMALESRGIKRIVLVTDPPHMLRSLLTFRSLGFTVVPRTSPLPHDLAATRKAMIVFYEYMGLVSYGVRGRFFPQSFPEVQNNPTVTEVNMAAAKPMNS